MTPRSSALPAIRQALESAYGLALGVSEEQVATAVGRATSRLGATVDVADPSSLAHVVDELPIDETWFFRDEPLWRWFEQEHGPRLLDEALARGRPVRILSLGCSGGQEPFSLAILFQGLLAAFGIPAASAAEYVRIHGVDSSPARIAAAQSGHVNGWSVQRCDPAWLRGRVVLEDATSGRHRVDPGVLGLCRFEVGNLLDVAARGGAALGGQDVVLCRNVLIYFRPGEAERVAAALARGLDTGSLLVVSAAEAHLLQASGLLEEIGHLGVGRRARIAPLAAERRRDVGARRAGRRVRATRTRAGPRRGRDGARGDPARAGPNAASRHVEWALEHAIAGRSSDALREARAACFHDPRHLLSRMVLGRELIEVDARRGREVLRQLLQHVSVLPQEAEVPAAPGLSVGQLAAAVRLLLGDGEGA